MLLGFWLHFRVNATHPLHVQVVRVSRAYQTGPNSGGRLSACARLVARPSVSLRASVCRLELGQAHGYTRKESSLTIGKIQQLGGGGEHLRWQVLRLGCPSKIHRWPVWLPCGRCVWRRLICDGKFLHGRLLWGMGDRSRRLGGPIKATWGTE